MRKSFKISTHNPPIHPMERKQPKFELSTKSILLTYSQCPADRETVHEMLKGKKLDIQKGVIAQEAHQDGNMHLHAYIKFAKQAHIRDARYFDIEFKGKQYHPNVVSAKSAHGAVKYCTKEDKTPLELGDMDYKQEIVARESKQRILGKRLCEGESLTKLIDEGNHEFVFKFKQIQANVAAYLLAKQRDKPICHEYIPNEWHMELPILQAKQRHYWFWSSEPNLGKTTFLKDLDSKFKCSWYNKSEVYQNIHDDSQFILIDEYTTPDIKCTTLNAMCDGTYQYPTKGGAPIRISNPIIICCGNKDPFTMYPNTARYIEKRFQVTCLDPPVRDVNTGQAINFESDARVKL